MGTRDGAAGWNRPARALHWLMALLILGLLALGLYMTEVEKELVRQIAMYQWHKSFGFTVFCLAVLRVIWRLTHASPALPARMPGWQKAASHVSHLALYVLIFATPLTGWLMATSSPYNDPDAALYLPNLVFGLFPMPDPYPVGDKAVEHFWFGAHQLCVLALGLVLVVHVAAALKHHFVDRDEILRRMIRG